MIYLSVSGPFAGTFARRARAAADMDRPVAAHCDEYAANIRDLLRVRFNAGQALPSDGAWGEGFDNAAETLFLSPIRAEKYLEAAKEALAMPPKIPNTKRLS